MTPYVATESPEVVMARTLLHLETKINARGWDQDPALWAICGRGPRPSRWTLQALMVDPLFYANANPGDVVQAFANSLDGAVGGTIAKQDRNFIINGLAIGPLRAVVFAAEAWALESPSADNPARPLADTVGAFEMRQVCAVCPDATSYLLGRRRGHPPVISWVNTVTGTRGRIGDDDGFRHVASLVGGLVRSLRRIVNVVNEKMGLPPVPRVDDHCNRCGALLPVRRNSLPPTCPQCGAGG